LLTGSSNKQTIAEKIQVRKGLLCLIAIHMLLIDAVAVTAGMILPSQHSIDDVAFQLHNIRVISPRGGNLLSWLDKRIECHTPARPDKYDREKFVSHRKPLPPSIVNWRFTRGPASTSARIVQKNTSTGAVYGGCNSTRAYHEEWQ
jgi:hypothetical protein